MPRASATSDSGSSEQSKRDEVIAPRKAKQKKPPPANEPSDTDEEMGENGEEGGEVDDYVVEDIRGHAWDKGVLKFEVKWEGWPDSDNTWEPQENLEEAVDTLNAYIDGIGGWPQKSKLNSGKKRGRRSTGNAVDAMQDGKRARLERNNKAAPSSDEEVDVPWPKTKTSAWQPPKPKAGTPGNWESMLLKIETVMVEADGSKWAYLLWAAEDDEGKNVTTRALLPSVYVAAPQAMLKFYESHLVFTNPGEKNNQAPADKFKPKPEPAEPDDEIED